MVKETDREIIELLEISKSFLVLVETKYNKKEISKNEYSRFANNKLSFIKQTNLIMSS